MAPELLIKLPRPARSSTLCFGEGGSYSIDDLRDRAAMLELLKPDINLMNQDLERLMEEILSQGPA